MLEDVERAILNALQLNTDGKVAQELTVARFALQSHMALTEPQRAALLEEYADAWLSVCVALQVAMPDWTTGEQSIGRRASDAIQELARRAVSSIERISENNCADALTDAQLDELAKPIFADLNADPYDRWVYPETVRACMRAAILAASSVEQPAAAPITKEWCMKMAALEPAEGMPSAGVPLPCDTCNGRGEVGGWRAGDGYGSDACPDCTAPAPAPADERVAFEYDDVVSICDAHGICLPVDCVEMVVNIVKLSGLLAARAASANETGAEEARKLLIDAACECLSPDQMDKFDALFDADADTCRRFLNCIVKRI